MKKEICKWCKEKKVIMVPVNFAWAIQEGKEDALSPNVTYLATKELAEKRYEMSEGDNGVCFECWTDSFSKSHPSWTLKSLA